MADSTTSFDIQFKTTADTAAVEKLNTQLGINAQREKELAEMRKSFLSAAEAEVQKVEQMTKASLDLAQAREAEYKATQKAMNPWASTGNSDAAKMVSQYRETLNKVPPAQETVRRSTGNMGNAMLQGSRAIQDMQYGLAGAVNNLEGIASAAGLGAGVAGAVTVLAVAIQTLGPSLIHWLNSLDKEGAKLDQLKERMAGIAESLRGGWNPEAAAAEKRTKAFSLAIEEQNQALADSSAAIEHEMELLKRRNEIQSTADKNLEKEKAAQIKDDPNLTEAEKKRATGLMQAATARAEAQRQQEADAAAEKAAQEKVNRLDLESEANRAQHEQAVKDFRDAQTRDAYMGLNSDGKVDPNAKGSITGLHEQIRALEAEFGRVESEFGTAAAQATVGDKLTTARSTLNQRQAFVDAVTTRTNGATTGELDQNRASLAERQRKLDRDWNQADDALTSTREKNRLNAVDRQSQLDYKLTGISRETGVSLAELSPDRIPQQASALNTLPTLNSPLNNAAGEVSQAAQNLGGAVSESSNQTAAAIRELAPVLTDIVEMVKSETKATREEVNKLKQLVKDRRS